MRIRIRGGLPVPGAKSGRLLAGFQRKTTSMPS